MKTCKQRGDNANLDNDYLNVISGKPIDEEIIEKHVIDKSSTPDLPVGKNAFKVANGYIPIFVNKTVAKKLCKIIDENTNDSGLLLLSSQMAAAADMLKK